MEWGNGSRTREATNAGRFWKNCSRMEAKKLGTYAVNLTEHLMPHFFFCYAPLMNRNSFLIVLPIVWLLVSQPVNVVAANELQSFIDALDKKRAIELQRARELRQQRASAQSEVLFWFRTHPTERVFPQTEVDRMLKSGGYSPAGVEGLTGSTNPFFEPSRRGEETP